MARRSNATLRDNARQGAIRRWCPVCQRKAALGAVMIDERVDPVTGKPDYSRGGAFRKCRYCGNIEYRKWPERRKLYERWVAAQTD